MPIKKIRRGIFLHSSAKISLWCFSNRFFDRDERKAIEQVKPLIKRPIVASLAFIAASNWNSHFILTVNNDYISAQRHLSERKTTFTFQWALKVANSLLEGIPLNCTRTYDTYIRPPLFGYILSQFRHFSRLSRQRTCFVYVFVSPKVTRENFFVLFRITKRIRWVSKISFSRFRQLWLLLRWFLHLLTSLTLTHCCNGRPEIGTEANVKRYEMKIYLFIFFSSSSSHEAD